MFENKKKRRLFGCACINAVHTLLKKNSNVFLRFSRYDIRARISEKQVELYDSLKKSQRSINLKMILKHCYIYYNISGKTNSKLISYALIPHSMLKINHRPIVKNCLETKPN